MQIVIATITSTRTLSRDFRYHNSNSLSTFFKILRFLFRELIQVIEVPLIITRIYIFYYRINMIIDLPKMHI